MPGHDRFKHRPFRQFLGFGLDHQNCVARSGNDKIEIRFLHLVDRRVELQRTLDEADAGAANGAMKGTPDSVRAAEAATIERISGSVSRSWLSTVTTTWVSLR